MSDHYRPWRERKSKRSKHKPHTDRAYRRLKRTIFSPPTISPAPDAIGP